MNKHYKSLELDRILLELSEYATCRDSKMEALNIEPLTDLAAAQGELQKTLDAHKLLGKFGAPSFGSLKNVNNSLLRANAGGVLNTRELLDVAENLRVIRSLSEWRSRQSDDVSCSLDVYFGSLRPNLYLENKIASAVISEEEISDASSPALSDIRRKIRLQSGRIREKLDSIIRSATYQKCLQDPIITQRNGRFVVPVKSEYRSKIAGLVHDTSASGATVFIEPMSVVEANNEIRVLEGKEQDEIERILSELSSEAGSFSEEMKYSYEAAVELNLIFAKAQLAYKMKANKPSLNDDGITDLKNARHPLLSNSKVVPVNISLGENFDTLVITGPNTGGKTVSLKTLGLLTLMAACGLMIPADEGSRVSVYKNIAADIGDEQSIEQSLSTFSSHMVNIIDIIKKADEKSLVLIDELGAGTDPVEGAALAMAILEKLRRKGAKIAATTHYAELKAYALDTERVENACCEFDVTTLRPTYRLLIGSPGRSNAFAISERLGMEKDVIERAKSLVSSDNARFENVVDTLEKRRIEMEKEKSEAETLRRENEELLRKSEEKLSDVIKIREKEIEKAKSEAARLVENSRREANLLLSEIEKAKKELKSNSLNQESLNEVRRKIKKDLQGIDNATDPVLSDVDDSYELSRPLQTGDNVKVSGMNCEGVILYISQKGDYADVQTGGIKMRVKVKDLRLIEKSGGDENKAFVQKSTESRLTKASDARCDLRGMTVDEAIDVLDLFLDNMVMSGLSEVTIIHGKGTGKLRAAVQARLKAHPQVKSYRLGVYGEGEDGVTIAVLK